MRDCWEALSTDLIKKSLQVCGNQSTLMPKMMRGDPLHQVQGSAREVITSLLTGVVEGDNAHVIHRVAN